MNWLRRWILRWLNRIEDNCVREATGEEPSSDSLYFNVYRAENGRILTVRRLVGPQHNTNWEEKKYIIPEGEGAIDKIVTVLVTHEMTK